MLPVGLLRESRMPCHSAGVDSTYDAKVRSRSPVVSYSFIKLR